MVAKIRQRVNAKSSLLEVVTCQQMADHVKYQRLEVQHSPRTARASLSRSLRRPLNSRTYLFYGSLVLGAALTAILLVLYFLNVLTPARFAYAIMFDAGSTGSRMHVFQIRIQSGQYKLENETYERVSPGLSNYAENPKNGALSLKPLLDKALAIVPAPEYSSTEIYLKATAGLRLLSRFQQRKLMKETRLLFAQYPFHLKHDSVGIMGGTDEGFYAWLTVAFLLGRDLFSNNLATLDLGGGSTQVTFIPEETATLSMTDHIHDRTMPGGSHITIYSHSYLRGGLLYGRTEILKKSAKPGNQTEIIVESPCIHPEADEGSDMQWQYFDYKYVIRADSEGAFSFSRCYSLAEQVIRAANVFKPKELHDRVLILMSYYFDRAVETGLIERDSDEKFLLVGDFRKRAEIECQSRTRNLITNEFLCVDLAYIYSLLHDGLGLTDSSKIWVVRKLQNSAVSWALGAALSGVRL